MMRVFLAAIAVLFALAAAVHAGYQAPPHIDGCQSVDGRFEVTAELITTGKLGHGPNQWRVIWRDTEREVAREIKLEGLTEGQIFGQLFVAPDGETFALFNHITLYSVGRSNMHGPKGLAHREDSDAWRNNEAFSQRLVIYRKDGSILKSLGVADFLQPQEWSAIGRRFNRVEWLAEYEDVDWKSAVRYPYAFCRVSPDYTVLELQIKPTKVNRDRGPRAVRVSLTSGELLEPSQWPTQQAKVPVRPCRGLIEYPKPFVPEWRERFVPSLDPVRAAGTIALDGKTHAMDDPDLPAALQARAQAHQQAKEARRAEDAQKREQADKTSSVPTANGPVRKVSRDAN